MYANYEKKFKGRIFDSLFMIEHNFIIFPERKIWMETTHSGLLLHFQHNLNILNTTVTNNMQLTNLEFKHSTFY